MLLCDLYILDVLSAEVSVFFEVCTCFMPSRNFVWKLFFTLQNFNSFTILTKSPSSNQIKVFYLQRTSTTLQTITKTLFIIFSSFFVVVYKKGSSPTRFFLINISIFSKRLSLQLFLSGVGMFFNE